MASRRQRLRAARAQEARLRRRTPVGRRRRSRPPLILIPIGVIAVAVIIAGLYFVRQGTGHPSVGEHWHAVYQIAVCGKELPSLPTTSGAFGIHSHGDGLIHSHPEAASQTGQNANLDHFFQSTGKSVQFDASQFKWGEQVWRNGDPCPDGQPGRVRLLVNGLENAEFERYVPQSGDLIRVEFSADADSGQ